VDVPLPPPSQTANKRQFNQEGYYNCYAYSWFIKRVYAAFVTAFTALEALVTGAGLVMLSLYPPLILWDPTTNSATLYGDTEGYDVNPAIEVFAKFWRTPLRSI
jgi:hypothetical protein